MGKVTKKLWRPQHGAPFTGGRPIKTNAFLEGFSDRTYYLNLYHHSGYYRDRKRLKKLLKFIKNPNRRQKGQNLATYKFRAKHSLLFRYLWGPILRPEVGQ